MIKKWSILILVVGISMAFVVPKDFEYYYKKGFEAVEQGNNAAAIYYLDSAIALNPEADTVYSLIAYPYYSLGKIDEAIEYANKAIEMTPQNAFAYYVRGLSYSAIEVTTDSLVKVVKKHKKDSTWMADNFYNRYFVADPNVVQFSGVFDYARAIKDLDKSLELDSTYAPAYASRAYYYEWLGQYERAKADYDKSIELQSDNPYNYLSRGKFNEKYGRPDWARDDYTKGIELNPEIAELYQRRGLIYYHTFYDREYACKDLTKATMLGMFIENLTEYCTPTFLDSTSRWYGGKRWRHDFYTNPKSAPCVCPNPETMFNPETDTIKEVEIFPGHKVKMLDIKDSEKTTWEFEDGRVIEISKTTEKRWLKEQEEKRKKDALIPIP